MERSGLERRVEKVEDEYFLRALYLIHIVFKAGFESTRLAGIYVWQWVAYHKRKKST